MYRNEIDSSPASSKASSVLKRSLDDSAINVSVVDRKNHLRRRSSSLTEVSLARFSLKDGKHDNKDVKTSEFVDEKNRRHSIYKAEDDKSTHTYA